MCPCRLRSLFIEQCVDDFTPAWFVLFHFCLLSAFTDSLALLPMYTCCRCTRVGNRGDGRRPVRFHLLPETTSALVENTNPARVLSLVFFFSGLSVFVVTFRQRFSTLFLYYVFSEPKNDGREMNSDQFKSNPTHSCNATKDQCLLQTLILLLFFFTQTSSFPSDCYWWKQRRIDRLEKDASPILWHLQRYSFFFLFIILFLGSLQLRELGNAFNVNLNSGMPLAENFNFYCFTDPFFICWILFPFQSFLCVLN